MNTRTTVGVLCATALILVFAGTASANELPLKPEPIAPARSGHVHTGFFQHFADVAHDKPELALASAQAAFLVADGAATNNLIRSCSYCYEMDPIARTFIGARPSWKSMIGPGIGQEVVGILIASKMRNSSHKWIRKTWWVPQTLGISSNVIGFSITSHNTKVHQNWIKVN